MNQSYVITPIRYVKWRKTFEDLICNDIFLFSDKNHKLIHKNTYLCFYVAQKGICAHAIVDSYGEEFNSVYDSHKWKFNLKNTHIYYDNPKKITDDLRSKLDAFNGRDTKIWSWFVQTTRHITENDFKLLIREE